MEKRTSKRIPVRFNASITFGNKTYEGHVKDISECGVGYLTTSFDQDEKDFTPAKMLDLNFTAPSGETLKLNCEVKWFVRKVPNDKELTLGMRVINPPWQYKKCLEDLHTN